jgi:hypothetical protein
MSAACSSFEMTLTDVVSPTPPPPLGFAQNQPSRFFV